MRTMIIAFFVVVTNAVAWAVHWLSMRERFRRMDVKHDRILAQFEGLRNYLYEIDPQFDDERLLQHEISAGMFLQDVHKKFEALRAKRGPGGRSLTTRFAE